MIRIAKELSPDQRAVIENLLGRRIMEDDTINVRAIEPPSLSDERKHELLARLKSHFTEVALRRAPVSPPEAHQIITEAMRSVRPGYHPRQ